MGAKTTIEIDAETAALLTEEAALADLDRFAAFLNDAHPDLAAEIAAAIVARAQALAANPLLGRPVAGSTAFRQVVLRVLNAGSVFQYRLEADRIVMLRVFHGRERRG